MGGINYKNLPECRETGKIEFIFIQVICTINFVVESFNNFISLNLSYNGLPVALTAGLYDLLSFLAGVSNV